MTTELWPTTSARDVKGTNRESYQERGGGRKGEQLPNFVEHLWQTPTPSNFAKRRQTHQTERGEPLLKEQARMWPTATGDDANNDTRKSGSFQSLSRDVSLWPTPTAENDQGPDESSRDGGPTLQTACLSFLRSPETTPPGSTSLSATPTLPRRLNVHFDAWLMGWPPIEPDGSGFSATAWSHYKARMHSALSSLCKR
jgi:hypothetical protein